MESVKGSIALKLIQVTLLVQVALLGLILVSILAKSDSKPVIVGPRPMSGGLNCTPMEMKFPEGFTARTSATIMVPMPRPPTADTKPNEIGYSCEWYSR